MKRLFAFVLTLASGFALSAAAQTPAPSADASTAPSKIAVIAFTQAVAQTNEGLRDFADLQKKYQGKEAALKALNDEIDKLSKDLQDQSSSLTETERNNRAKVIDDKKKQLERSVEDARNSFQQEMQDLFNGLQGKVYDVMQAYAEQQGFTLILDASQQTTPVLYAGPSTDITKAVIEAYNLKSGVPAPPAQPAGAESKPKAPATTAHPAGATPKPATTH